jgi:hypothetical protein
MTFNAEDIPVAFSIVNPSEETDVVPPEHEAFIVTKYFSFCITPIYRLQKYDSPLGGLFFAQLHVYNYAGHYCSVKSVPIGLPSLLPPASGIVLDIYPDALPPYRDTDVIFNSTTTFIRYAYQKIAK